MNPYPERLEDLHAFLATRYGHRDTQATEILLAALLPPEVTYAPHPWIILETDYPSQDTSNAWFSFGGESKPHSLSSVRVLSRRDRDKVFRSWIETKLTGGPGLFVEPQWRDLHENATPTRGGISYGNYNSLVASTVRLRVAHPRGDFSIRMNREGERAELSRLTRKILDNSHRSFSRNEIAGSPIPNSFLYWCEMLQRVSPWLSDWESLIGNLSGIARGIWILRGEGTPDWSATDRIIRNSINSTTHWIMRESAVDRGPGRKAWDLFKASGHSIDEPMIKEIRRLHRDGILLARKQYELKGSGHGRHTYHPWRYRLGSKEWHEIIDTERPILV